MRRDDKRRLELAAEAASLARLDAWLGDETKSLGLGEDARYALRLCAAEAVANIIDHGEHRAGRRPAVIVTLELMSDHVALVVADDGGAFDPLAAELPPSRNLDKSGEGGYGLRLIRGFADSLDYERRAEWNRLTVLVRRH